MLTLSRLQKQFSTEDACKAHLEALRWPNGVTCPRCGHDKVATLRARPFHWQCKKCSKNGYRFSVIAGTIFENTNIPLTTWFQVVFLMCTAKKGMSAMQVHRTIGVGSYRTAWYMCHRLRAAMQNESFMKLTGVVEVDETYIGGKDKNKHRRAQTAQPKRGSKRGPARGKSPRDGKAVVIGAIARKGNVVARVIEKTDAATMAGFVREVVADDVSLVATDEHQSYKALDKDMPHESVAHGRKEYVRGDVHTGTIDGFWSLIKRGIMGSYHSVSKDYLPLYLNEFSFRNDNRGNDEIFDAVLRQA